MESTLKLEATAQQAIELGLKENEFELILELLGRTPNFLELSIFATMWSDACSYKNSVFWLRQLPQDGGHVLVRAGEESAGAIDLGDGTACVFKMEAKILSNVTIKESNALLCDVNSDVVAMGARPIAQLNSLSFGLIENEENSQHIKNVMHEISIYTNDYGVPMVGGEVSFNEELSAEFRMNFLSVGIVDSKRMVSAKSKGVDNPVFIVGNINDTKKGSQHSISGKLLLEATMELLKTDTVIGMQSIGAGGFTGACIEMSSKGAHGMELNLDEIFNSYQGLEVQDILLKQSDERILIVLQKGKESVIQEIFEKWEVEVQRIGRVTETKEVELYANNERIACVPVTCLVLGGGAPQYENNFEEPSYFERSKAFKIEEVIQPEDLKSVAYFLLKNSNIASKTWFCNQFDASVGNRTITENCYADAAIIDLRESNKALALSVDSNMRYLKSDPKIGAMIAVAEAARNVVCAGGEPSAITNSLIFGNPEMPTHYWQFVNAIQGIKEACVKFNTPVTSGDVVFSPSNKSKNQEEFISSATIGMVGLLADKNKIMTFNFKQKGDLIFILGQSFDDISSSAYLVSYHGIKESPAPYFDLEKEFLVQQAVKGLIQEELVNAVHDVSEGGLFITLTEMALPGGLGFDIVTDAEIREDAFLFGEGQGRVVVAVSEDSEEDFIEFMMTSEVSFTLLGHVTKGKMMVDDEHYGFIAEAKDIYENAIVNQLSSDSK
jgi:phosphoribosylformylglycinamidine synthase subunit PurL